MLERIYPNGIDWAATGGMLSGLSAIIASGVVVWTALTARKSFLEWTHKEQFRGEREAAVQVLSMFYRGEEILKNVRATNISRNERRLAYERLRTPQSRTITEILPHIENKRDDDIKVTIDAQVSRIRLEEFVAIDKQYVEVVPVARAFFGTDIAKSYMEVHLIARRIDSAIKNIPTVTSESFKSDLRTRMFASIRGDDRISVRIGDARRCLEDGLLPIIRRSADRS